VLANRDVIVRNKLTKLHALSTSKEKAETIEEEGICPFDLSYQPDEKPDGIMEEFTDLPC
jgi:hypothetical protein